METSKASIRYYNNLLCEEMLVHLATASIYFAGQDEACQIRINVKYDRLVSIRLFEIRHHINCWYITKHGYDRLHINNVDISADGTRQLFSGDIITCGPLWAIFENSDSNSDKEDFRRLLANERTERLQLQQRIASAANELAKVKEVWATLRQTVDRAVTNDDDVKNRQEFLATFDLLPLRIEQITTALTKS